jgi:PAS domain S-box-containing protein
VRIAPCIVWVAGAVAIAAGAATLLGYALGLHAVASLGLHGAFMPESAASFMAVGAGLWLIPAGGDARRRRASQALGLLVASFAALVLAEYATGHRAGTDMWLFPGRVRAWTSDTVPGRPSPYTAVSLLFLGLTLALLDVRPGRRNSPARILMPATALVAAVILVSYLFGLSDLRHGTRQVPGIALTSTLVIAVLTAGLLASRPERPPTWALLGNGPATAVLRQLVLVVCAGLALIAALTAVGGSALARYDGLAVVAMAAIVLVTFYVLFLRAWTAMDRVTRALRAERDFTHTVLDSLSEGVIVLGPDAEVLRVTPRWCEISGFPADEVLGRTFPYPWWAPDQLEEGRARVTAVLAADYPLEFDYVMRRAEGTEVKVLVTATPVLDDAGLRLIVATYHDLTGRRHAEAEHQRAADQLDQFFNLSADLLCIAGTDGYFKRVNPAWERALGYTTAELCARPWLEFVHPDDVARSRAETTNAVGREVSAGFSNRYRCRDGSYRWLSWKSAPATAIGVVYAVARDITDERQAGQAQARLAAIVDGTNDAIVGMTLNGTILSWNAAAERLYGYQVAEVMGQPISLVTERPGEMEHFLQSVARGTPLAHHRTTRVRKDRTRLQVEMTISPIRDGDGTVVGAASIARDMTERVKAEERFRRLVLAAPDAMVIVDSHGRIALVNEQTEQLFGYSGDELLGEPVELLVPLLIPEQLRERHIQDRDDDLARPQVLRIGTDVAVSGRRRDGTEFPVEISLAPLDTDEGQMASAVIRDISERREVEQALARARDEALAAAQLKSQFVAMVSHEIRTPMNGVIGLTDLLLDTPLQPPQQRYAQAIRSSGRALLAIINDILDFSKIEAGKIGLTEADFDLDQLLDLAIQVTAEAARDKDLEIVGYYPPGLPTAVRGDAGRLRQVLLNLLGNAVKFTEHGEVVVRASAAGDGRGRPRFTFSVIDTGIGIAPQDLMSLFQPFSQVDASANRQFGGTGLGLPIARQLIELMDGQLDVQSQPGLGSRFSFTIPLTTQSGAAAQHPGTSTCLSGLRILLADDSATSRALLSEHATAWGLDTTAVSDASTALALLRDAAQRGQPYAAAVIDQHMPGVSGVDLAQRITAESAITRTKTVLLTSGSYSDDNVAAAAGAAAMLPKPVRPSQLYNCLLDLLGAAAGQASLHAQPAPARHDAPPDRGLILLAEDNEINQMVAADNLSLLGYRVDVVRNGSEAVQVAATKPYRAILMDCQMPTMDGYAATSQIRLRERPDQRIPIIAMTAGALAEDRQRCLAAGMDDYLSKPIDPEELRMALDRWTGQGPQAAEGTGRRRSGLAGQDDDPSA